MIKRINMSGIYDCQQGWSVRVDWGKRRPAASETKNSFALPRSGGTPLPPVIADNCSLRKAVFSCVVWFSILSAIASSRLVVSRTVVRELEAEKARNVDCVRIGDRESEEK